MTGRPAAAALGYGLATFAAGFLFGSLRLLLLAPKVGTVPAALIEVPLMLGASWLLCDWAVSRFAVAPTLPDRVAMGALAFIILMACEFAAGFLLFGIGPGEQLRAMASPAGRIGLVAQLGFAAIPALWLTREERRGGRGRD